MKKFSLIPVSALAMVMGLTGCLRTTRLVRKTQAPEVYRTATVEVLEKNISDRDAGLKTLNAAVLITAATGGGKEGKVTEYTSLRGFIFVRKPADLRVLLQKPVLGSRAVDMVSDGKTFTLLINGLTGSRAIVGTNVVTTPSKNGLENLRPAVFFDSMLVPGVTPEEYVTLTESTRVLEPVTKHRDAIEEPDYDITVMKPKAGNMLQPERVIHISRVTMLPFEQDIYDEHGRIVTVASYEQYQPFGDVQFPMLITIKRPLDEYSLKIEVTKLTVNEKLEDDQFELKVPAGVPVKKME